MRDKGNLRTRGPLPKKTKKMTASQPKRIGLPKCSLKSARTIPGAKRAEAAAGGDKIVTTYGVTVTGTSASNGR